MVSRGHRIEPETGLILLTNENQSGFTEWEAAVLAALADPALRSTRRFLSDRRKTAEAHPWQMIDEILDFFRRHGRELADAQWAVLAAGPGPVNDVARLAEVRAQPTRVRVKAFTELRTALQWLLGAYEEEDLARLELWVEQGRG